eukprot:TRINITY_DN107993_c0_g1_i1.p1 TRINITY_DN107993_c0_g1~~TRINITY_DN107993_c0_g1_i1.p1  ORF type:complete len:218 (+),score=50.86 TRINITY_DN107993_c0_g1_i1:81-734(+)
MASVVVKALLCTLAAVVHAVTEAQVKQVQDSWASVQTVGMCDGTPVMDIFFDHLFKDNDTAAIFGSTNMPVHKKRLWAMLNAAVNGLSDLDTLVPILRGLGARHKDYGVQSAHFSAVGASLIYTLDAGLGEAFTPELKSLWETVYGIVQEQMDLGLQSPDNKTVVADKQAAYGLLPTESLVSQCSTSTTESAEAESSGSMEVNAAFALVTFAMCMFG